jgi:hypothetical protein
VNEAKSTERRLAWLLTLSLITVLGCRSLFIGLGPEARLLSFVPDDAFYYFGISRGYANFGEWTFDSGFSSASGFHLLHAYFNVLILDLLGSTDWRSIVGVNFGVAWFVISIGVSLMATALYRRFGLWGVIGCVPVVLSRNFLLSTTTALEWSWVILASSVFIFAVQSRADSRLRWFAVFGAGLVGSAARFDFGGLPAVFAVCAWAGWWFERDPASRDRATTSTIGLMGSAIATCAALLHHWVLFDDPIPASAQIKGVWASLVGSKFQYRLFLDLVGTDEFPLGGVITAVLLGLMGWRIYALLRSSEANRREQAWLSIAASLTIVFYIALYSRTTGVQLWYSQNFVMPTLWLVASMFATLPQLMKRSWAEAVVLIAIGLLSATNVIASLQAVWPWQVSMKYAGTELAGRDSLGRVGAWNAGILGFFGGGSVVNIDGLVNDEIVAHLDPGTLDCYLKQSRIQYLADFDVMLLSGGKKSEQGGYSNGSLIAAAVPIDVLAAPVDPKGTDKWSRSSLLLYRLEWERVPDDEGKACQTS